MPENINTPSIALALVHSNHRFRKEVMLITLASILECTKHMRVINGLKGKETEATIVPQAKWRPYHSEKVVTGTAGLTARTLETFPLEILEEFDPENLYTTIFGTPFDADKVDLEIVRKLLQEEMKNASRGLCDLLFRGVRVADGTGALDGFDGFDTIIAKEHAAGNISLTNGNFANIGELNEYNIVDTFYNMFTMIDEALLGDSSKKLKLICSIKDYQMYKKGYAIKYGTGIFAGMPEQKYLDGTNDKVEIVPLPGMEGSSYVFITTQENMKVGADVLSRNTVFEVRRPDNPNLVQMHAKIYLGVDFANIDKQFLFVGARTIKSSNVFMTSDTAKVTFADTTLGQTNTAKVKLFGFNMTASSELTVEGTDKSEFTLSANNVPAADANAESGVEITITFAPTTTAGARSAQLRVSNATDNVNIVIPLRGNGVSA